VFRRFRFKRCPSVTLGDKEGATPCGLCDIWWFAAFAPGPYSRRLSDTQKPTVTNMESVR